MECENLNCIHPTRYQALSQSITNPYIWPYRSPVNTNAPGHNGVTEHTLQVTPSSTTTSSDRTIFMVFRNKTTRINLLLAAFIAFSPLAQSSEALASRAPFFQSGICEFEGPDHSTDIVRNIPNAMCSLSFRKQFDSARYIIRALDGHAGASHWLWRSGPSYVAKVSPKSIKICKADTSDRRKVIGLKPGKCVVTLVTRKSERFSPLDNTNKGDFYSASVVIDFTK